jgi:hypothetical protein
MSALGGKPTLRLVVRSRTPTERPDTLRWLMEWYEGHCDGDGEHDFGPGIGTIDNPGWSLKVPREGAECNGREFFAIEAPL